MATAQVVYSVDARLGGGGHGNIACQAAAGLYQSGRLRQVFASSNAQTAIPAALVRDWGVVGRGLKYWAAKDRTGLVGHLENIAFDAWASTLLPPGEIWHGWNGGSYRSIARAKRRGMVTVVERASSHPDLQTRLLQEEYQRWGIAWRPPQWNLVRMRRELEAADFVTVPSPFVRDSLVSAGVPEAKLIEIPFGVDLARFVPGPAAPVRTFRAIFVGQVSLRKGIQYLLQAWAALGWTDAELWVVGSVTPDARPVVARHAGLPGVRFVQHTPDVAPLLRQSDVFVFPSIEEGSALVTYEALACGLPVITTPNAGSVVRHGSDGFLTAIRDVKALCQDLQCLRDDPALRAEMGRSARQRAEQYPWQRYQGNLLQAYRQLTGD